MATSLAMNSGFESRPASSIAWLLASDPVTGCAPIEFEPMTAKEKLLREVLDLDEAEAAAARIVIERRPTDTDGELEGVLDEEVDEAFNEMDAEERKAGFEPWKT